MSRTRPRTAFDLNEVSRVVGPVAAGRSGPRAAWATAPAAISAMSSSLQVARLNGQTPAPGPRQRGGLVLG